MSKNRFGRRLIYHILLSVGSVGLSVLFMRLFPHRDLVSRVSIGTAYAALFLISTTLLLGPLNVLRERANPVSFGLRRDCGIWGGIVALVHTVVGLNVHLQGKMWLYFVDPSHHLRRDVFGVGNYTGTIAAFVFVLLLALSNDISLRSLGIDRWKSLQRWAYAAFVFTAAHSIAYQQIETRSAPFQVVLYVLIGIVLGFQTVAAIKRQRTALTPGTALLPRSSHPVRK